MKKNQWVALAGITLLSAGVLAACSSSKGGTTTNVNGGNLVHEYSYVYTSDPTSLDYTVVNKSTTSDITSNLVDGLLEYDNYGNIVPSLAKDGRTYTYTLRDDAKWFTSDGEEYAAVTAEDFVTGLKHAADSKSEALYLVQGSIVGLDDYVNGKEKDFSKVGVKAVDDHTVEYTLNQPESYWNSKVTNGILFPINAEFLKSKGDKFGSPDVDGILANGPFLLSAMTNKSSIEYTKNENYWDADKVQLNTIKLSYYDGNDPDSLVKGFKESNYTQGRVYPSSTTYDSVKKEFGDNIVYSQQDATVYWAAINVNRTTYDHTKKKTGKQKESTQAALRNKDFRQALGFAVDRVAYSAQSNGEDGATRTVRNSIVPPSFVQIGDKDFGKVVTDKLVSYGDEWKDMDLSDAQDGFYNKEKAKVEFDKAKAELGSSVEFPIHLDLPSDQSDNIGMHQAQSMKQSIEDALGKENVVVDVIAMDSDTYMNTSYYAEKAEQNDYDISTVSGWAPDYDDPSTYLDIMNPDNGSVVKTIGINPGENKDVVKAVGLDEYKELLEKASAENTDIQKRYELYAEADAWLTDSALLMPTISRGGTPSLTKTVPFTRSFAWSGTKGDQSYKYLQVSDKTLTTKEYEAARKKWQDAKKESNAKAQEELSSHVK